MSHYQSSTGTYEQEALEYRQTRVVYWDEVNSSTPFKKSDYYRNRLFEAYKHIAFEGSTMLELGCGQGDLLAGLKPKVGVGIDFSSKAIERAREKHPNLEFSHGDAQVLSLGDRIFDFIIISDLVNELWDVQALLLALHPYCAPHTRLIFNFHSHLWNIPLSIAAKIGIARAKLLQNWLTPQDMRNMLEISGFEPLRAWAEIIAPVKIPIVSNLANRYLGRIAPFRLLSLANFLVARPSFLPSPPPPKVSVIVAARNESGHIKELLPRIPEMGAGTEVIFVEGNSTDDTYDEIQRVIAANPDRDCKLLKQTGKGKGDAVRKGFESATGDILMILDADITVPPEDLPRFYALLANRSAEFVNGVRLVYPMEGDAMRFANLVGNKFFSWAFSWLLGQPIRDTLCGTKVLWKSDYDRIANNRSYFGNFDPFGDFDLLFGAARLNLKILEVPIRYRARRYGETNISRWSHGWLLLKMVFFAAKRIKFL